MHPIRSRPHPTPYTVSWRSVCTHQQHATEPPPAHARPPRSAALGRSRTTARHASSAHPGTSIPRLPTSHAPGAIARHAPRHVPLPPATRPPRPAPPTRTPRATWPCTGRRMWCHVLGAPRVPRAASCFAPARPPPLTVQPNALCATCHAPRAVPSFLPSQHVPLHPARYPTRTPATCKTPHAYPGACPASPHVPLHR